jgi:hypothetical protein
MFPERRFSRALVPEKQPSLPIARFRYQIHVVDKSAEKKVGIVRRFKIGASKAKVQIL